MEEWNALFERAAAFDCDRAEITERLAEVRRERA